ncbi:MAG: hypothetical protein WCN95_11300 [bacterium]
MHIGLMFAVLLVIGGNLCAADVGTQAVAASSRQWDGTNKTVRISGADLQSLWGYYLTGEEALSALALSELAPGKVPEALDAEICRAFASSQAVYRALFLGLCESSESLKLLEGALTNGNPAVVEEAQMALARRGNSAYEEMFIRRYVSHPIATNMTPALARDKSSSAAYRPLFYIGSPACMAALFDSIPQRQYNVNGVRITFMTVGRMRRYFAAAGIEIPGNETTDEQVLMWWRNNRESILMKLRARDPKTLPRMEMIGIATAM